MNPGPLVIVGRGPVPAVAPGVIRSTAVITVSSTGVVTVLKTSGRTKKTKASSGIPDMKFIRTQIAVVEIAKKLGLRLSSTGLIHCWNPSNHQNGDRTASV